MKTQRYEGGRFFLATRGSNFGAICESRAWRLNFGVRRLDAALDGATRRAAPSPRRAPRRTLESGAEAPHSKATPPTPLAGGRG
jgi:hypothetical protein